MNVIVTRIEELRKIKGLKKKDIARKSGISRSTINNWYFSNSMPNLANIENVCNALNITIEQFFSGIGNEKLEKAQKNFIDSWRMLSKNERAVVANVMRTFKEIRMNKK